VVTPGTTGQRVENFGSEATCIAHPLKALRPMEFDHAVAGVEGFFGGNICILDHAGEYSAGCRDLREASDVHFSEEAKRKKRRREAAHGPARSVNIISHEDTKT
jgi:hypothetical protein